jgi:dihydrofolate reductase
MAMTLITTTNITLDGVAQGLGGPDEDRRGRFDRGGWAPPLADSDVGEYLDHVYPSAAAFLFGRFTYEIFADSWGTIADMKATPIGAALNDRPKYLVSTSLTNPEWADTTVLRGDLATAIRDLQAQNDGKLVVPGSISLVRWLLANHLIDQIDLLTYPIVVGQGTRLFPESGPDIALHLLDSRTTAGGVTIQTFQPAGRPNYVAATAEPNG